MHNFMAYDRRWLDRPHEGDHVGRTAWALGEVVGARPPSGEDRPSLRQLEAMEPLLGLTASPRTIAFALLGLVRPTPDQLPHTLNQLLRTHGRPADGEPTAGMRPRPGAGSSPI